MSNRISVRHGRETPTLQDLLPYELGFDYINSILYIYNENAQKLIGMIPTTGGTITGTLVLSKTTDASGTADKNPALKIGDAAGTHLEFDGNEIMAKSDGVTPSQLNFNVDGGLVVVGSGGLNSRGNLQENGVRVYSPNNKPSLSALGAAPAGYGVGAHDAQYISDWSTLFTQSGGIKGGFYYANGSTTNLPTNVSAGLWRVVALPRGGTSIEADTFIATHYTGLSFAMTNRNGVVNGPLWISPALKGDIEYPLFAQDDGNPLYVKRLYFGALPNNGQKNVELGVSDINYVARIWGRAKNSSSNEVYTLPSGNLSICYRDGYIVINTPENWSGYIGYIFVYYTKS